MHAKMSRVKPLRFPIVLCVSLAVTTSCGQNDVATLEANKALVRRWAEAEDQGKIETLDALATPDCVFHYPGGAEVRGLDALKQNAAQSVAAFSDARRQIDLEVAEGDLVATRYTFTAKHTGEYMGVPPTGNDISLTFMSLCRVVAGRMSECWIEFDTQVLNRQLGIGVSSADTAGA